MPVSKSSLDCRSFPRLANLIQPATASDHDARCRFELANQLEPDLAVTEGRLLEAGDSFLIQAHLNGDGAVRRFDELNVHFHHDRNVAGDVEARNEQGPAGNLREREQGA